MNIFGIVYAKYADNMVAVHTSLGRSVVAYNLDPSEDLQLNEQVGVIQIGDTFTCYRRANKPLRSVLALSDPQEYGKIEPAQYFMAVVAHKIGNVIRLYDVATIISVFSGQALINKQGNAFLAKWASWVKDLATGDEVLFDNELGLIVGYAGQKKAGDLPWLSSMVILQLCDENGDSITSNTSVAVTKNKHNGGKETIIRSADSGNLMLAVHLPDTITMEYIHNGKKLGYSLTVDLKPSHTSFMGVDKAEVSNPATMVEGEDLGIVANIKLPVLTRYDYDRFSVVQLEPFILGRPKIGVLKDLNYLSSGIDGANLNINYNNGLEFSGSFKTYDLNDNTLDELNINFNGALKNKSYLKLTEPPFDGDSIIIYNGSFFIQIKRKGVTLWAHTHKTTHSFVLAAFIAETYQAEVLE